MIREFLSPFLLAFLLSTVALYAVSVLSSRLRRSSERTEPSRRHKTGISRLGGVALAFAFFMSVLADVSLERTPALLGLLLGTVVIAVFGTVDDFRPMPWPIQLGFQVLLAVIVFASGMRAWVLTNPFGDPLFLHPETRLLPSLLVGIVFTVLVMNAMNWADGVDGLLGGISSVALLAILFVSLRPEVNQPTVGILAVTLLGCSFSFLAWNAPPARILAGTAGSFFFGFAVSALALFSGVKIATVLLALSVPVLDALFVIRGRLRAGESPFRGGDARHLHDRLRQIGWSDRKIALSYTGVSALAAGLSLSLPAAGKALFLFAFAFSFVFFLSVFDKSPVIRP